MRLRLHYAAGWIAAVAVVTPPQTEPTDCAGATQQYKENVEAVMNALRKYEACVSGSNGRDKCAAEIQALDSAHDDFEDMVTDIEKSCATK
ncbi:MAG TPA: hypothetical protein VF007_10855 [Stellaceae bacterium]